MYIYYIPGFTGASTGRPTATDRTPIQRGGNAAAPSKLHMTCTNSEQSTGKPIEQSKNDNVEPISHDSPIGSGNLVPKVSAEPQLMPTTAGGIVHKPTEEESKTAQSAQALSKADELRKLKQAQKKSEWQKKRLQSKADSGGVAKEEGVPDGYDLNELVSEGQWFTIITLAMHHSLQNSPKNFVTTKKCCGHFSYTHNTNNTIIFSSINLILRYVIL